MARSGKSIENPPSCHPFLHCHWPNWTGASPLICCAGWLCRHQQPRGQPLYRLRAGDAAVHAGLAGAGISPLITTAIRPRSTSNRCRRRPWHAKRAMPWPSAITNPKPRTHWKAGCRGWRPAVGHRALDAPHPARYVSPPASPSSRGPGRRPLTPETGVRLPLGTPVFC